MFYDGLSVPPVDPYHLHHGRGEDEGSSVVGAAVACPFAGGARPDSARVTSSAMRNRSSKATRSMAALSWAALASSSCAGLAVPYAHEPTTTAAIVSPCAMIRTRSQLFNECDWPLRIFVIAITSAVVVAAAPVKRVISMSKCGIGDGAPTGTRGCCLNLRSAFSRYVSPESVAMVGVHSIS